MMSVPYYIKKTNRLRCSFPDVNAEDSCRGGIDWGKTERRANTMWQKDEWGGWYLADQKCIGSIPEATGVWNKDDETGAWYLAETVLAAEVPSGESYRVAV